jgi:hypothetical protein
VFPPFELAAGTCFPRGLLCSVWPRHEEAHFSRDISMAGIHFQSDEEMSERTSPTLAALIEAARPYLVTFLMVAMLMSVWIGFRAG